MREINAQYRKHKKAKVLLVGRKAFKRWAKKRRW